jgi:hypothetical protein
MRASPGRLSLLVLLVACLAWTCGDDDDDTTGPGDGVDNTDFVAEEPFSYGFEVAGQTRFWLEGMNGHVSITGVSEFDSVIVAGAKRVGSESLDDAQEHLADITVVVTDRGTEFYVETQQPEDTGGRNYVVNYEVSVPDDMKVVAHNVNGTVRVESMSSDVSVENTNGSVALEDVFGNTDVVLVNGEIGAEVTIPLGGTIDMGVTNGTIDLEIPEATSAQFSARVTIGSINVYNLDLQDIESSPTSLTGTLGNGEGTIDLSTVIGSIVVTGF